MSSLKKKYTLVMLPTTKASIGTIMKCLELSTLYDDSIDKQVGQLTLNKNSMIRSKNDFWQPQHLYILSNGEIKEEDWKNPGWYVDFRVSSNPIISNSPIHKDKAFASKKVVAATDKSLIVDFKGYEYGTARYYEALVHLPQLTPQFIEDYIESYNKGKVITNVEVEYEQYWDKNTFPKHMPTFKIKVDSQNCITIAKCNPTLKELCKQNNDLRKEIENLLFKYAEENALTSTKGEIDEFNKWVKQNI